jgi:hypothetical protein
LKENNMTDVIKQLNDKLREKRERLNKFRDAIKANAEQLRTILADFVEIGAEPIADDNWVHITVTGDKNKFLQFCRAMRKHGVELPKIEKGSTGFTKLHFLGEAYEITLYFQFSSTQCRRVKVGTKMVEQEVFEVVCDEIMPYEHAQPIAAAPADDLPF